MKHFELNFVQGVRQGSRFTFLIYGCTIGKTILSPLNYLCIFVKKSVEHICVDPFLFCSLDLSGNQDPVLIITVL